MIDRLKGNKVVGVKQTVKALKTILLKLYMYLRMRMKV